MGGVWIFRKPEPSNVRGLCIRCGKNPQKTKPDGKFYPICSPCNKRLYAPESTKRYDARRIRKPQKPRKKPWRQFAKLACNRCSFIAEYEWQIDVHHIDGNKKNNQPENLESLCPICHRTETIKKGGRPKPAAL